MGGIKRKCQEIKYKIKDIINDISLWRHSGYYPSSSVVTQDNAKKIADELAELKEEVKKDTEKKEKETLDILSGELNEWLEELKSINNEKYGGKSLNINIQKLVGDIEKIKKETVGFLGGLIEERLVLTDKELEKILKIENDKNRKKEFNQFCKKIYKEGIFALCDKIEISVKEMERVIRESVMERMDEVDAQLQETKKSYDEVLATKDKSEKEMIGTQMKYIYRFEITDIFLDNLES